MCRELTTAIDGHEAELPGRDQAGRVASEEVLLAVTLDRTAVVQDPVAPDRGRWLVGRAAAEVGLCGTGLVDLQLGTVDGRNWRSDVGARQADQFVVICRHTSCRPAGPFGSRRGA